LVRHILHPIGRRTSGITTTGYLTPSRAINSSARPLCSEISYSTVHEVYNWMTLPMPGLRSGTTYSCNPPQIVRRLWGHIIRRKLNMVSAPYTTFVLQFPVFPCCVADLCMNPPPLKFLLSWRISKTPMARSLG